MRGASGVGDRRYRPDPGVVDRAVDAIARSCRPQRIIVFGSFARGDTHELSDLDLIVVAKTEERFFDRIGRARDACADLDIEVRPFVYTPEELAQMLDQGNAFLETALAEGRVAYESPDGRED